MKGPNPVRLNDGYKCGASGCGQFSAVTVKDFGVSQTSTRYSKGMLLFAESQEARGIYLLRKGEVKLSISSVDGKTLITRIARAGELLGLIAAISNQPYEVTAETIYPCLVSFVPRDDFLRFLANHLEAFQNVVKQMSLQYRGIYEQLRIVGLSASAQQRLARLLLSWSDGIKQTKEGTRIKMRLTHEEIAEFIGTSRETVTRTLADFKLQRLVTIQGSILTIPNRAALESFVKV